MQNKNNERLHIILSKLCKDVEIPISCSDGNDQDDNKCLIELVEINNYPYPMLQCPHLEEKGIGEDCVECQHLQYETYKKRFLDLAKENGYEHAHTLKAVFDYYSTLITQYKLTECDELLDEIYPICLARGNWSTFYILAIQSRAFLRFKQSRYQEALEYFEKQLDLLGPNEKLYENMALVYARLNQNKEAAIAYARAILLIQQQALEKQNYSTLLMGLAGVLDNIEDAFVVLEESLKMLRARFDKPHSLMAKTLGAMGDLHMKKNNYLAADNCYSEAVQIFTDTCGFDSPLTATAMNKQANCLLLLGDKEKACTVYVNTLKVWTRVDDYSFSPNEIYEALLVLQKNDSSAELVSVVEALQSKIVTHPILANNIHTLCLLKFIYELYIIKKDIPRAIHCCHHFKECLGKLDDAKLGEFSPFREKLLVETMQLLEILENLSPIK